MDFLVVGLGNPGTKYEKTRHNLGFMVVDALAKEQGWSFKRGIRLKGHVASGMVGDAKVFVLKPNTYMNLSGQSVRKCMEYYKIAPGNVLIVVDDVYLKLGTMRLRAGGSPGGHNGLKSVEALLGTQDYPRLRMGVGAQALSERTLEAYVLGNFTAEEFETLPRFVEQGVEVTRCWLTQGIEPAAQLAGEKTKGQNSL